MGRILGGHFELLAEAARGGMGSIFRGRDQRTGRMVAIKTLDLTSPSDQARFERECQVLAHLHHPNIVGYVAHGASPEGTRFLIQEWVDGVTLSTQVLMLGLTARDAIRVGIGVSAALGAAHALGAVHRDVKPANIILDEGDPDRVKLVDFGIARLESEAGLLTRAGILVGTPSYMAPEQARGSVAIPPAADVWALGCVLYEALSGRKAFAGRSPEAILAKAVMHEPTRLDILVPELPVAVVDYVHSMLAKHAADRPKTGRDVEQMLRDLLPAIADGPLRKANQTQTQPTRVVPALVARDGKAPGPKAFVLVSVPPPEPDAPARASVDLKPISDRYQLVMHPLDDGSILLEAPGTGANPATLAYAALEIQAQVPDGAVSVFGQAAHESFEDAVDRGADKLADMTMASMFADSVDVDPVIPVDDVIADLFDREGVTMVTTEQGRGLAGPRPTSA